MESPTRETVDGLTARGEITIREYPAGTLDRVSDLFAAGEREAGQAILDGGRIAVVQKNLIMQGTSTGKDLIVQRLLGINTYSLNLLYGEIGTGTTTPAITDTALTTPVARSSATAGVVSDIGNNTAQIQYFFPDSTLTNSVYTEFGCFVDGTATLGSGQLFNHALFTTAYTKAAGTDITVQVQIAFS